ncbi:MAG: glutathione S-transferase [Steroidobacteraceae bacterium]
MKLFYAATSPFVRKCLASAYELGLRERLELMPAAPHPVNRDRTVVASNPLGKIPTLITDDGAVLYDSRVICEYLNAVADGALIPPHGPARWRVLVDQALADGVMDAAVLVRYESAARPEQLRWNDWITGQLDKVTCGLAELERRAHGFAERVDAGTIAVGCALGYLDFRFASLEWREKWPDTAAWFERFAKRESMVATRPPPA